MRSPTGGGQRHLMVAVDHGSGLGLRGAEPRSEEPGPLLRALGEERCRHVELVSADRADWIAEMVFKPRSGRTPRT